MFVETKAISPFGVRHEPLNHDHLAMADTVNYITKMMPSLGSITVVYLPENCCKCFSNLFVSYFLLCSSLLHKLIAHILWR